MKEDPEVRVLKTGSCPSLTGKSKLTYEIGAGPAADLHVRISRNSGTGYFNSFWVKWTDLLKVLEKARGEPITSFTLRPLYAGRSVNTAGFLLAALMNEGLVQRIEDRPRCYRLLDARRFLAEIDSLAGGSTKAAKAAKPVSGKTPAPTAAKSPTKAPAPIATKAQEKARAGKR